LLEELAGSPEEIDALRFAVLDGVVKIVNDHRVRVCRIAYTNHKEIADRLKGDP